MLSIRTNMASIGARRNLNQASEDLNGNFSKLSSGYRITRASDDAAGLGVSTNLRSQITSYKMAVRNANDGISMLQTTEAALNESAAIVTRLRELTIQAASDGLAATERQYLNKEVQELVKELDRIAQTTEYNGRYLLGSTVELRFQVGIGDTAEDAITVQIDAATVAGLGLSSNASYASVFVRQFDDYAQAGTTSAAAKYQGLLVRLDRAMDAIAQRRATLGATANRLTSVGNTLSIALESAQQSNSRIRDVDVAAESAELGANQVLVQAGTSMLAQANQAPETALKLLKG